MIYMMNDDGRDAPAATVVCVCLVPCLLMAIWNNAQLATLPPDGDKEERLASKFPDSLPHLNYTNNQARSITTMEERQDTS